MRSMRENTVVDVVAEHVGEAQRGDGHLGVVLGEVADQHVDLQQRTLDRRGGRVRATGGLAEEVGIGEVRPVHQGRRLQHDLAHRAALGRGGREQVHGADHVDLVQPSAARTGGVDLEVGVQHGVDLRGAHHAPQDRVRRVGLHELGAGPAAAAVRGCRRRPRARRRRVARAPARCGCPRTFRGR